MLHSYLAYHWIGSVHPPSNGPDFPGTPNTRLTNRNQIATTMATRRADPGERVDIETWAEDLPAARTKAIAKTDRMRLIRLFLPAGKELSRHKVAGLLTVHCIRGKAEFTAMGITQHLAPGQLLYLMP